MILATTTAKQTLQPTAWPATPATTLLANGKRVHIPPLRDLASFRQWVFCDEIPEKAHIGYFQGQVRVDLSMEQLFWHNRLKAVILAVLEYLIAAADLGELFVVGARLSNIPGDWSTEPDGMFVSYASLEQGRVRLVPGRDDGFVEVEGTPDWVLENVSDSSEEKDLQVLRECYWQAGIAEYWLVDARGQRLSFQILRRGSKGFVATRHQRGFVKSALFGKSFQLTRSTGKLGQPKFALAMA